MEALYYTVFIGIIVGIVYGVYWIARHDILDN